MVTVHQVPPVEVGVADFRRRLKHWLDLARDGQEVVVTDRGLPVARVIGATALPTLERLTRAGVVSASSTPSRPRASGARRVRSHGSVSELVSQQRE
ncbi:MAG: type II toxin-antitoxin system prevent-host-death family antitoxin [Actinomycetota bacterium]|nr:type II toxin-antitoxin system prevent-host-death family antitoxin [Actinomycetota bacterium]